MARFDPFKRRRERESAIPAEVRDSLVFEPDAGLAAERERPTEPERPAPGPQPAGPEAAVGLGELASLVHQAFKTGEIQVAQGDARVIDLSGPGVGDEIREALRHYGIEPDEGEAGRS